MRVSIRRIHVSRTYCRRFFEPQRENNPEHLSDLGIALQGVGFLRRYDLGAGFYADKLEC